MHVYNQQLLDTYNEAYQQLNEQQRLAVDTIEGPVMVIAGPGTGKTQILAARIGKILQETDVSPDNILCLTYTDAGAIAMRRRLQQFIGSDAYKVHIYTFHAFCNDVIQDNLFLFEKNSLDAISELESIQLFKKLIDNFPKNHPLKRYRGDEYFEINNLRKLFSTMKKEGWEPNFINEKIDEYIAGMDDDDSFLYKTSRAGKWNKGDKKPDYQTQIDRMEKLRAAVHEFDHYQALMRAQNRYDFDDMINWVIKVFEEDSNVLANYQEKFQYILLDEFQDTSGTQNKLVSLLIEYWDKPNIFVVGDDDQSIFRFQGANVENMLSFAKQYDKDLLKVVLTNNYRSTQPILDISKLLIDKNNERLIKKIPGLRKDLIASNTKINGITEVPELLEYETTSDEWIGITNKIDAVLKTGVSPGEIAVIYKEHKYGEAIAAHLRLKDIPVYSKRNINLLVDPFTKKIIHILGYLHAEHDASYGGDEMLFEIMHYDFYKIPPIEIARLNVEANQKKFAGESVSLRKHLFNKANAPAADLFSTGLHEGLKNISSALEQLISDASNVTLQQLFENLIRKAGILTYLMQSPEKIILMQKLAGLFDFIKTETARNPYLDLAKLIEIIDMMKKEDLAIPFIQVSGTDKAVNLLTAHGSKGLEFEYVFFVGANASLWESKRAPSSGYKLPDNLLSNMVASSGPEELRRLFYVALTRAEKKLAISYAKFRPDGKELEPSMFIAEITEQFELQTQKIILSDAEKMEFQILQFSERAPKIESTEVDFITRLLEKFVMNVTALNSYLKCPLGFYYQNLIRIPSGKNEATEFGSAIHFALEKLFRKMLDNSQETGVGSFPSKDEMMEDFNWYMKKHRELFTRESFARRMEYGDDVLRKYYDTYVHSWSKVVSVERNIRTVLSNGIPIRGKLDKLEFNGKEVNVVDYKSGNIDNAIKKLNPPNEKDPNGGDYWRQAVFYKILIDNYDQKDWRVISTEFDFVEPDKNKKYRKEKIVIMPQDMETVKQQLTDTWQKIQNFDFYTGCGKEDCHWCNFVKDNNISIPAEEIDEEPEVL